MMQKILPLHRLLLGAALLAICLPIIVSSSSFRERRHVGVEESSHRPGKSYTPVSRGFKSSTSRDNEITTEPGRKVSHRLIGGHLRVDSKQESVETIWDDGILLSSAGNGKESRPNRKDDDDEKKTLSQQVKEGKYGLIQNEIYANRPKRPGIISYLSNPEVPKDTIENLGGLDEDEIWLAENHVLVLRGGKFPGHETTQSNGESERTWPPIDNYKAPRRQVKIPSRPKVPPPFPVQLTEGGPIQIIGPNGTKEIGNGTLDYGKDHPLFMKSFLSEEGPLFAIISNGTVLMPNVDSNGTSEDNDKGTKPDPLPGFPPFYHAIPPGAVFVPPPSNQSDYDEEDQSIYYPPPYSFQYQQDNTTAVPPGPLVPGIILPPPPDFFSPLEDKKTTTKKYTKRPGTTPVPRQRPTYLPPRKLTTKYKTTTTPPVTKPRSSVNLSASSKTYKTTTTYKNLTATTPISVTTVPYVEVTTPTPDKPTTLDNPKYYNIQPILENQVTNQEIVQAKNEAWSGTVTSKTLPILSYHTSTQSTLEKPIEVTPASIKRIVTTGSPERSPSQASYYFYEESNEPTVTTADPSIYFKTTTESPFYETVTQSRSVDKKKQFYSVETVPSQETSKDYSVKYIDTVVKNSEPVRYSDSVTRTSLTRSQGQRMLPDRAPPLYYQTISTRPPAQPYYTTPRPQTYYRQDKPKPIYQYSFETADYTKRGGTDQRQFEQHQTVPYNDYQDVKIPSFNGPRYDYEQNEPTKRIRPQSLPYKSQQPIYPSTMINSAINTTPNPHLAYYTQQDEKLLDDVTKEYFTIFGKKIPHKGIPSTTPIYGKSTERPEYNVNSYVENNYNTPEPPVFKTPNVKVHYGDQSQRPYSLKDDILVNYRQPLPPINPDSEFITVVNPNSQQPPNYRMSSRDGQPLAPIRAYPSQQLINQRNGPSTNYVPIAEYPEEIDESYPELPISLEDDIKVNYRDPRPTINPDAEFIDPNPVPENQSEKPKAYFAYRLPGDSGHFYFLTPQAVTQRPERNAGHIYAKSRGPRPRIRRRRPGNV
ncbi:PREDICTED: adhesive plaque matrix protein [Dufourea novaeangliae]|uniref:Uncharacterized protein n=1 Tax=Dufourea novaeangliae TaxID=178035 RepID=A0A154P4M4_DUFNO|nr:PREDICTED: adhesive plaque matrix protein [Dufourea novaeangliae]KZC06817.1 hypothetical protein WN55_07773 [Dufourea novaeangliae]